MENFNFYFEKKLLDKIIIDDKIVFRIYGNDDSINIFMYLVGSANRIGEATITTMNYFIEGETCYYVHSVGIAPKFQNMGYGTMLMKVVVTWLQKCYEKYGLDYAMLYMTKERLEDKIRFYKRVGFVLTPYANGGITPMFYSFNEKGNEIINQVSVSIQEYKKAYQNEMSFFSEKAKILSKKELYDLLYEKTVNLNLQLGCDIKNEERGKYTAYQDVYCTYINDMTNFSWYTIFNELYARCKKKQIS